MARARPLIDATASTMIAAFPLFLLGALAVFIRPDLGFSETALGTAVAVYFGVSAAFSAWGGRMSEQIGAYRAMSLVAGGSAVALLGIATLASSYSLLLVFLILAGIANAPAHPSATLLLVTDTPPWRHGVMLGVKQSAPLMASIVSGVAVPIVALQVGWRWAFAATGVAAVALAWWFHRLGRSRTESGLSALNSTTHLRSGLLGLAVAAGVGQMANSFLISFFVESAVSRGVGKAAAGLSFAAGGLVGIVGRIAWGWLADRPRSQPFRVVATLMGTGSVGYLLLTNPSHGLFLSIGTALAFATGFAWAGVLHLGVVRLHPSSPAAATGKIHVGSYLGGVAGPLLFAIIVEATSYPVAWTAAAGCLATSAVLVWLAISKVARA